MHLHQGADGVACQDSYACRIYVMLLACVAVMPLHPRAKAHELLRFRLGYAPRTLCGLSVTGRRAGIVQSE